MRSFIAQFPLILMAGFLLGACPFLLGGCSEEPPPPPPKATLRILLTFPPETTSLVQYILDNHKGDLQRGLPADTELQMDLQEGESVPTAQAIAKGTLKSAAWITPLKELADVVNSSLVNLGAPQRECTELFWTPVVVASRQITGSATSSESPGAATWPLQSVFGQSVVKQGALKGDLSQTQSQGVLLGVTPFGTGASANAGWLQLLTVAGLLYDNNQQKAEQSSRASVSFLGDSPASLLRWINAPQTGITRIALSTEQIVLSHSTTPVDIAYPQEGSVIFHYHLCLSEAEWVGPAERSIVAAFMEALRTPTSVSAIQKAHFRIPQPTEAQPLKELPLTRSNADLLFSNPSSFVPFAEYVFVLDTSGGMSGERLDIARSVLARTFSVLLAENSNLSAGGISLISYDREVQLRAKQARSAQELTSALSTLQAGGSGALFDGLKAAYDLAGRPDLSSARREIFLVTDGHDLNSQVGAETLRVLVNSRMSLAPINLTVLSFSAEASANSRLKELIEETGGRLLTVQEGSFESVLNKALGI